MQVSAHWLKDYAKTKSPVAKLAERLTMTLSETDAIRSVRGLQKIKVGEVLSVRKHPDADSLWITQTKVGKERYQIVCGADNVAVGEKVAVALPGTTLPDGLTVGVRTIRGTESHGMLCSPKELGIGEDHSGIWLLPADTPVGKSLTAALGGSIDSFELDVPANRPDCLGHLGVAREVAAAEGARFTPPKLKAAGRPKKGILATKISDKEGCSRFILARLQGLTNAESPAWIRERLVAVGLRPINAVVDITNFVMLEYGQPLHAYDAAKLTGTVMLVRKAAAEETLTTLDGKRRTLDRDTMVIADRTQALGIAGIMGGSGTEVSPKTTEIVLECANFNGARVRRTSRKLGLRTEASARFEKGLPAGLAHDAIRRAIDLILEVCGGRVVQFSDTYPVKQRSPRITLDPERLVRSIGMPLKAADAVRYLKAVGFTVKRSGRNLAVAVPVWRTDVADEADLFEEVARLHGYHKLPSTAAVAAVQPSEQPPLFRLSRAIRTELVGSGCTEVITHSLVGPDLLKKAGYPAAEAVRMENPLSADHSLLRRSMEPRHLEAVADNLRWTDELRLVEIGRTFKSGKDIAERNRLLVTIARKSGGDTLAEARGRLTALAAILKLPAESLGFTATKEAQYRPGRQFNITSGGTVIGHVAEYGRPSQWKAGSVSFLSLELDRVLEAVPTDWHTEPIPTYPPVFRDLSVFLPEGASYADLAGLIRTGAGELLDSLGDPREYVQDGRRSLAVKLSFRRADRTLKDAEVNTAMDQVAAVLRPKGYEIRE